MLLDGFWLPLLIKIAATVSVVLVASYGAERGGPFWGGLICGVPIASGPAYVMLALHADAAFVAQSALSSYAATTAATLFILAVVRLAPRWSILPTLAGAIAVWLIAILLIRLVTWTALTATIANGAALTIGWWLSRDAVAGVAVPRPGRSRFDLPLRALAVGLLVAGVVTVSQTIGPSLTGIALVFPISLLSFTLVIHGRLGGPAAAATMANALRAMPGFTLAFLVLNLLAPLGVALGLVAALACSLCYVSGMMAWRAYAPAAASANSQLRNKRSLGSS
jgi:hypothetical protein